MKRLDKRAGRQVKGQHSKEFKEKKREQAKEHKELKHEHELEEVRHLPENALSTLGITHIEKEKFPEKKNAREIEEEKQETRIKEPLEHPSAEHHLPNPDHPSERRRLKRQQREEKKIFEQQQHQPGKQGFDELQKELKKIEEEERLKEQRRLKDERRRKRRAEKAEKAEQQEELPEGEENQELESESEENEGSEEEEEEEGSEEEEESEESEEEQKEEGPGFLEKLYGLKDMTINALKQGTGMIFGSEKTSEGSEKEAPEATSSPSPSPAAVSSAGERHPPSPGL